MTAKVVKLSLPDLWSFRQLFKRAVATDFDYFPLDYRQRVLRQNSLFRSGLACLRPSRLILGAKTGRRLVGYLVGSLPSDGRAQIFWLYVDPRSRTRGLGEMLLGEAAKIMVAGGAISATLITAHYQEYYQKRGFSLESTVRGEGDINMAIMTRSLDDEV